MLTAEWSIGDTAGLFVLQRALECFDEMTEAQRVLASEGTFIKDRFGQARLHPATQREKEARGHLVIYLRELGLDLESINATKAKNRTAV